jgi:hypothetical protein
LVDGIDGAREYCRGRDAVGRRGPQGSAIGRTLSMAVGVALSPIPIIAVILMLVTPRASANGPAFVVRWLVGLAIVGAVVLRLAGPANARDDGEPATWVDVLKLVLGALLVLFALKQWRTRPHDGEEPPTPKWMGAVESFTPIKALGASAVLAGANPHGTVDTLGRRRTTMSRPEPPSRRRGGRHVDSHSER